MFRDSFNSPSLLACKASVVSSNTVLTLLSEPCLLWLLQVCCALHRTTLLTCLCLTLDSFCRLSQTLVWEALLMRQTSLKATAMQPVILRVQLQPAAIQRGMTASAIQLAALWLVYTVNTGSHSIQLLGAAAAWQAGHRVFNQPQLTIRAHTQCSNHRPSIPIAKRHNSLGHHAWRRAGTA